jgi:hypothetical protein
VSALKPITILRRARKLIEDPTRWTKHRFVRYTAGGTCDGYCAVGALNRAAGCSISDTSVISSPARNQAARIKAYQALQEVTKVKHLPQWNDRQSTSHARVLKAFDKAIALLS